MGRPKTSGHSHNKKSSTYKSKRMSSNATDSRQKSIFDAFRSQNKSANDEETENNAVNDPEKSDESLSESENEVADDHDSVIGDSDTDTDQGKIDGRSYLVVHQSHEKWENRFPFAYYSASKKGWLCKVCSNYKGSGDEYWKSKGVRLNEHPSRLFTDHSTSKKHQESIKLQQQVNAMLSKGSVYKQTYDGALASDRKSKQRNRRIIKKFLKTTYFLARKKWAVRENFADVIDFIRDLGDVDITDHLRESSKRATYLSTTSTDEFLKCLSDHLEEDFLSSLAAASEFSLMADETTDIADRAQLSIFIRYVDAHSNLINEKFIGIVEVIGSKGAEALCDKICEVLQEKGIDKQLMRFNGFDGTNTMSGEISGLQRRFRHLVPHVKYINCRNHRLALVFVHLLPRYESLTNVDNVIIAVWKLMKYSSVKASVFGSAQAAEGQKKMKLLKAAPTRWLSHGEASKRLVSRFESLTNALDTIIHEKKFPEVKGIRDQLLEPNTILFLLLLTDILSHVNRFSRYLQTRNLIFGTVTRKFTQLKDALHHLSIVDGPSSQEHALPFLEISRERMGLARRLRGDNLVSAEEILQDRIDEFNRNIKTPYMADLISELDQAMGLNDPVLLAYDVFNVSTTFTQEERYGFIKTLGNFYGETKSSTFQRNNNTALPLIQKENILEATIDHFFGEFDDAVRREQVKINTKIKELVKTGQLTSDLVENYKCEHPVSLDCVYADMVVDRAFYPDLMKLLKFALLITPSTANVERGFSVLTLLVTKHRNSLATKNIDRLMRLVLLGPDSFDDRTWEILVDKYKDMKDRRIDI